MVIVQLSDPSIPPGFNLVTPNSQLKFLLEEQKKRTLFKGKKENSLLSTPPADSSNCYLKSGTLIKVEKGMSEGLTRFILYLNISDGEEVEKYITEEKSNNTLLVNSYR
jgi:hypothetical protein